tara:strand:- start:2615 stop:2776 length:162 start_codon:yes stop_codon:yes gene_type:complete
LNIDTIPGGKSVAIGCDFLYLLISGNQVALQFSSVYGGTTDKALRVETLDKPV